MGEGNFDWPNMRLGNLEFSLLGSNAGNVGYTQADDAVFTSVRGDVAFCVDLSPDPGRDIHSLRGSFTNDSASLAYSKTYLQSVDALNPKTFAVGDVVSLAAGWGVVPKKSL